MPRCKICNDEGVIEVFPDYIEDCWNCKKKDPLRIIRIQFLFLSSLLLFVHIPFLVYFSSINWMWIAFTFFRRTFPIIILFPLLLFNFPHLDLPKFKMFCLSFLFGLVLFSLYQWRFSRGSNNWVILTFGFRWSFHALFTWSCLFLIQFILYLKWLNHLPYSLLLSFFGCMIGGILYELPNALIEGYLFWSYREWIVASYVGFSYLLARVGFHFKHLKLFMLSLIPLILEFPFHSLMPYWIIRLTPFPLMILFSLGVKQN